MWLSPPLLRPCTISDSLQRASFHHVLFKPLICYWYEQHQRPFQHLTSQPPQHATNRDRQDPRGLAKQIFSNKVLAQRIQSSDTDLTQVDLYIADIKIVTKNLKNLSKERTGGMQSNGSEE